MISSYMMPHTEHDKLYDTYLYDDILYYDR